MNNKHALSPPAPHAPHHMGQGSIRGPNAKPASAPKLISPPVAVNKVELEAMLVEAKAHAQRLATQVEVLKEIKGIKLERVLGILEKLRGRIADLDGLVLETKQDPEWDAKETLRQAHIISKKALVAVLKRMGAHPGGEKGNVPHFLGLMVTMAQRLGYPIGLTPVLPEGAHTHRYILLQLPEGQVSFKVHEALLQQSGVLALGDISTPWDGHDTPTKNHRIASYLGQTRGQQAAG